ncbi:hypothetical protein CerSpe_179470 [Prunus speciosa]
MQHISTSETNATSPSDITRECPFELRVPGACKNACVFNNADDFGRCSGPTSYSRFFKARCPDAYSYSSDDETGFFSCPGGTNSSAHDLLN